MAVDSLSLLVLFGITIIVGYIGYLFFDKTRIPDVFWLMIFGILVGPVFNLVDRSLFLAITPFLAALALIIILFDAGVNMDFYKMLRSFPRSILMSIVGFLLTLLLVAGFAFFFMDFSILYSLLMGTIVGGTSSAVVISIARRLKVRENPKMIVILESIFTDPIVIVVSIVLLNIISQNTAVNPLQGIISAFSVGAVTGFVAGVAWLFVLEKIKGKPFDYMLTLSVLFLLYVSVESVSGSGAIAALAFGLVLGNGKAFSIMLKMKHMRFGFTKVLRTFQGEVSFFIRSFFFVYLGIIVSINPTYIIYGLAISIIIILVRLLAVNVSTYKLRITKPEKDMIKTMAPRGLASAVLAQLPVAYGIPNAQIFSDIVFVVILATVIYTTIATRFLQE